MNCFFWYFIFGSIFMTDVYCDSSLSYTTRWPYPHNPNSTDWSSELKKRPIYHNTDNHRAVDAIFDGLIRALTKGDSAKKAQLTLYHEWFPIEAINCFDRIRDLVTKTCVDWSYNPYVQKFGYIIINMCNAGWLNTGDIEEGITNTCKKRLPLEDLDK